MTATNKHHQILVVDDNATYRETLASCIHEILGFKAHQAANAVNALAHLQQHATDLLIMSTRMPEMNGVDLLVQARAHRPGIKVIVLFSGPDESKTDSGKILSLGAYMVVNKAEVKSKLFPVLTNICSTDLRL